MKRRSDGPRTTSGVLRPGQTILFEGDSLTSRRMRPTLDNWAFLRLSNWHGSWADAVEEWIFCNRPDLRIKCRNAAVGGSTCRNVMSRFESCVVPIRPDWVIFTLGGNDRAQKISLEEFGGTVADYARRLRELCGGRLAAVGGFKPCPHAPADRVATQRERAVYQKALRQVVTKTGGIFIDAGTVMKRNAELLYKQHPLHTVYSDNGHFNAVGNQIIATQVLAGLGVLSLA